MKGHIDIRYSEREGHTIENPKGTLVSALNTLFASMQLVHAARKKILDESLFSSDFTFINEEEHAGDGFRVRGAVSPMPLELRMENIMRAVAGTVFLQFDEVAALLTGELKGGRFGHPDADMRAAFSILYLVRCAFAHNPLAPTWRIDRKHFQSKIFEVKAIELQLNTTDLNGQVGVVNRIGGWVGTVKLLDFVLRGLAPNEHATMRAPSGAAV